MLRDFDIINCCEAMAKLFVERRLITPKKGITPRKYNKNPLLIQKKGFVNGFTIGSVLMSEYK